MKGLTTPGSDSALTYAGSSWRNQPCTVAIVLLFLVGFVLRLSLLHLLPNFDVPVRGEMERVATTWATTGQLANPYSTPTGPTAHVPPLYPILLGSIYRLFGTGAEGHSAQAIFACAVSAARCALLLPLAILLGLGFRTGLIAGTLSVFYITAYNTEMRGSWEAPLAGLFLMVLTATSIGFKQARVFAWRDAVLYGVLVGIGVLLSPTLAPPMMAFLLCTVPFGLRKCKRYVAWLAVLASTAFLIIAPWLIRNACVMGSPVIRSNLGLELSLAYNDQEKASALDAEITNSHPLVNQSVSRHVADVGEIAFNRECEEKALGWIRQHPGPALRLVGEHIVYFWFPPAANPLFRIARAAVTVLSFLGFGVMTRRRPLVALLVGLIWISFPLIYYVTYWSSRYRYPMEWTFLLSLAVLLDSAWAHVHSPFDLR